LSGMVVGAGELQCVVVVASGATAEASGRRAGLAVWCQKQCAWQVRRGRPTGRRSEWPATAWWHAIHSATANGGRRREGVAARWASYGAGSQGGSGSTRPTGGPSREKKKLVLIYNFSNEHISRIKSRKISRGVRKNMIIFLEID
jgi:hypothetical protein